ncbi:hypothetical protein BDR06DRAFT_573822 [Suillus hirtellus]|nr:hypothetical protein BDR06DRAFT_573822 [Suillus hirtellus]
MRLRVFFCIILYLVGVIQAAPTINATNITTSDNVEAPSFTTRTLGTIIFSSVLTLFACIYSAIHPNISSPKESGHHYIIWRQLSMTIMALIAPELIVAWAMRQWFSAHQVTRQFERSGYPNLIIRPDSEDSVEVPATGNCFTRFLLRLPFVRLLILLAKGPLSVPVFLWRFLCAPMRFVASWIEPEPSESDLEDYNWTQTHSFFVLMGGFMLYVDGKPYLTLRPDYILKFIQAKCIDVPTLTAKQIRDRSKGNAISKALVVLQVAWFVLQLITRAIYHLETTQLEVGTLAFAVLSFLTYAMWWDKPLDVRCSHPVYWKSTESMPEDHIDVSDTDEFAPLPIARSIFELMGFPRIPTSQKLQVPTFDGSITLKDSDRKVLRLAAMLMATIFGGVHCMAWFFAFPTHQQQMLWRISAVATTCTPWLCWSLYSDSEVTHSVLQRFPNPLKYVVWGVYFLIYFACFALYVPARAVLLVLMFTTLHNLPPDAYKAVSWTSMVPHL